MNTEIDRLISLTYEIEGLLLLLRDRGQESMAPHIRNLLADKGRTLSALLAGNDTKPEPQKAAPAMPTCPPPVPVTASTASTETKADCEIAKAAEIEEKEEADMTAPAQAPEPVATLAAEPATEEIKAEAPTFSTTKLDEAQAEEAEADSAAAEEEVAREKHATEIKSNDEAGKKIMKLFSFNDTFRFRRELFGGSDTAMKAILAIIGTMPTLDEAKRYLIEDQGMDPESEEVAYFFEIIAPYYNK